MVVIIDTMGTLPMVMNHGADWNIVIKVPSWLRLGAFTLWLGSFLGARAALRSSWFLPHLYLPNITCFQFFVFSKRKGGQHPFFLVERAGSVRAGDESALVGEEPDHRNNLLCLRVRIRIYNLDENESKFLSSVHLFWNYWNQLSKSSMFWCFLVKSTT